MERRDLYAFGAIAAVTAAVIAGMSWPKGGSAVTVDYRPPVQPRPFSPELDADKSAEEQMVEELKGLREDLAGLKAEQHETRCAVEHADRDHRFDANCPP